MIRGNNFPITPPETTQRKILTKVLQPQTNAQ